MKVFTAILSFSLAAAPISNCFPAASNDAQNDTSANDYYTIEGCGSYGPSMVQVIDAAIAAIAPAIRDAEQYGARSHHGFKAMFKNDGSVPLVVSMLRSLAALTALPYLQPTPHLFQKPRFACVNAETIHRYPFITIDLQVFCSRGPYASFYVLNTSYIFVCPIFWSLEPYPDNPPSLSGRCPQVNQNAFITYPGYEVYHYQSYIIIHELTHFYLQHTSLTGLTIPAEQYQLNGCVALNAPASLFNPQNFQTYVAMVEQGCVQSPDPSLPPWAPGASKDVASLPHLNASSPSGFSLSDQNALSISTFKPPPSNFSRASGANLAIPNAPGAADSVDAS